MLDISFQFFLNIFQLSRIVTSVQIFNLISKLQDFKISLPIFQILSNVSVYWYSFNTSSIHVFINTYEFGITLSNARILDSNFSKILQFFMIVASVQFFNWVSKISRFLNQPSNFSRFFQIVSLIGNPFVHLVSMFLFPIRNWVLDTYKC